MKITSAKSHTCPDRTVAELAEPVTVTVQGGDTLLLHPDHESVVLPSVPAAPGAMVDSTVRPSSSMGTTSLG